MGNLTRERQLEIVFITIFSVLVLLIFYTVVSMNGVVLGNDPAVHLVKAQIFLQTGQIPLVNLGWTPPLYELLLAMLISLSGATGIGQMIFLVKALAAVSDWLLFMAVYLLGSRFFNKKVGAVSAVLLLMCFPVFEANEFGGYTTVLGVVFILFVLLYLTKAIEQFGYLVVTFLGAFALVLSHQLAAFVAAFLLPPILLIMVIKSRGRSLKVVLALLVGAGIAFLYYFQAMFRYIGLVVEYVFFAVKTYAYEIPSVSFNSFLVNFGFILFLALGGIVISFFVLRKEKKGFFYAILMLSFFVPLFFAESYLFGFFMPFQWFNYYLTPAMAIFAAVSVVFIEEKFVSFYSKKRSSLSTFQGALQAAAVESQSWGIRGSQMGFAKAFRRRLVNPVRRNWLKILTVSLVILMCMVLVFRSNELYGKILQASVFYSTTDPKALDAGVWLSEHYPGNVTVVDTEIPGYWFSVFSGKNVTAQTSASVETNDIAWSVLSLSYAIQDPQNIFQGYEAYGDTYLETYVSIDGVWEQAVFSSTAGDFISFTQNGVNYDFSLSNLTRDVYFNEHIFPKQIEFLFSNQYVALTETLLVPNDTYTADVSWSVTPLAGAVSNVTLYLTNYFNPQLFFDTAQIPGLMDWVNPWNVTSRQSDGTLWTVVNLPNATSNNYVGVYDNKDQVGYAFDFTDYPNWGNIGALGNGQIDAVRFQYQFSEINADQSVSRQYQVLCLSKDNFTALQPGNLENLLSYKTTPFGISTRDFQDYIALENIQFIVYDKNQLDPNIARCRFLQQVYSNDRYVIFKILPDYNQTQTA